MPPSGNKYKNKFKKLNNLLEDIGKQIEGHNFNQDNNYNKLLDDLQANILKSHQFSKLTYYFLQFKNKDEAISLLSDAAGDITTAKMQLDPDVNSSIVFANIFLTLTGYKLLEIPENLIPDELKIADGKLQQRISLKAEKPFVQEDEVHAILLFGNEGEAVPDHISALINRARTEVVCHRENKLNNYKFKDGISNPVFFPRPDTESPFQLSPLDRVLTHDKAGNTSFSCGSYGVILKMDINENAFDALAGKFGKNKVSQAQSFANVVGRFPGGAALINHAQKPEAGHKAQNSFDYSNDPKGTKCPFHAHIRKAYPRTKNSEQRQIVRRGMFYEEAAKKGLLFMSFQRSLVEQFEYILENWMLNENTLVEDPVTKKGIIVKGGKDILFSKPGDKFEVPESWGSHSKKRIIIPEALIDFKGGIYFYAPSISFFERLHYLKNDLGTVDLDLPFVTNKSATFHHEDKKPI